MKELTFQDLVDFVDGNRGHLKPEVPVVVHSLNTLIRLSYPTKLEYEVVPDSEDLGVVVLSGG